MPNGVSRNHRSRHANRYRQQDRPLETVEEPTFADVVVAEVFNDVVVVGEVYDDRITELENELRDLKRQIIKERKDTIKITKQQNTTLKISTTNNDILEAKLEEILRRNKNLSGHMSQYEFIIHHLEKEGHITFHNQSKDKQGNVRRLSSERTLGNMEFVFLHDREGNEITFKDINGVLEGLQSKCDRSKNFAEMLIRKEIQLYDHREDKSEPLMNTITPENTFTSEIRFKRVGDDEDDELFCDVVCEEF